MKNGKMQFCYEIGDAPCRACDVADILNYIEDFPAADVRPVVHGKWVHLCGDEWLCNACGFVISTEGSWEHPLHDREKFFCEHCGADMREVGDER